MFTPRRAFLQVVLSVLVVTLLALTSPRPARTQDGRAVPTDVRVVNPNTAPVFASVVNTASAPVQAKIVNALGAPVPANIINPATAPVQAKIVNGPASPVQTSLVGSPVVGARQSGAWNVNVTNSAASPIPTYDARAVRTPFQYRFQFDGNSYTVPGGKRLVIEYVGLGGYINEGGILWAPALATTLNGTLAYHYLPLVNLGTGPTGFTFFEGTSSTRIYADPGTQVAYSFGKSGGTNSSLELSVSGYLEPSS